MKWKFQKNQILKESKSRVFSKIKKIDRLSNQYPIASKKGTKLTESKMNSNTMQNLCSTEARGLLFKTSPPSYFQSKIRSKQTTIAMQQCFQHAERPHVIQIPDLIWSFSAWLILPQQVDFLDVLSSCQRSLYLGACACPVLCTHFPSAYFNTSLLEEPSLTHGHVTSVIAFSTFPSRPNCIFFTAQLPSDSGYTFVIFSRNIN